MEPKGTRAVLLALGLAESLLAVAAARWISRGELFPVYLASFFAMAVVWLAAIGLALRLRPARRGDLPLLFAVALLLRAPFLLTPPVLSDDIFRYLWDGRVQLAGVNPYLHPPESEALAFLRDERYQGINNKEVPTIYPPWMQAAFLLASSVSESLLAMKLFFVAFDFALIAVLARLLASLSLNPMRAVAYAWSPLAAVEVAGSGHNDVFAVFFLVAALWLFEKRREAGSVLLLTLCGLAKLAGFALLPLWVPFVRARALAVVPVTSFLVALPYLPAGEAAFAGLREYGLRWRANDSLFHLLLLATGSLERAKLAASVLVAALVLSLAARRTPPARACYLALGAILLLMPTVHPWYFLWIAPLLAVYPQPAWLYLTVASALAYHAPYLASPGEPWQETGWVKALEYVPFFALLGLDLALHATGKASRDPGGGRAA